MWLAVFGAFCYLWLKGRTQVALVQALLVPLPVTLFLFFFDLDATGEVRRAAQWLLSMPAHAFGVGFTVLWLQRHPGIEEPTRP